MTVMVELDKQKRDMNKKIFSRSLATLLVASLVTLTVTSVHAVRVGPQLRPPPVNTQDFTRPLKSRMNIPSMSIAIPVLNPGIPSSVEEQEKKGVWPELRQTEAVRCAFHIRNEIRRYNQFDSLIVSPDATVSADLYLLGSIVDSTSEITRIRFELVDSTGKVWVPRTTLSHRVELGWHERYGGQGIDPFQPLYAEIALKVYEALKTKAKAHVAQLERNQKASRNQQPRLSELQRVVAVRKLVMAQFFSPTQYSDTLSERNGVWQLDYLPDMTNQSWARIESVSARENNVVRQLEGYYEAFLAQVEEPYSQWQTDAFPIAREVRLQQRKATVSQVAGAALVVLSAASALDGAAASGDRSAQLATSLGALAGGALVKAGFETKENNKFAVGMINEIGRNMHTTLKPVRVEVSGQVVTLQGTASEQFTQWRSLLAEMYENESVDFEAVAILEES